jgi:hypothetical protein
MKAKVSKIMVWPSRKVNLGNYSTVDLNAGIEIVFDKPVAVDGKEVKEAFGEARKVVKEEFKEQFKPYLKIKT